MTPFVTDTKWLGTLTLSDAGRDSFGCHVMFWHRDVMSVPSMSTDHMSGDGRVGGDKLERELAVKQVSGELDFAARHPVHARQRFA